jgi:hypothetical protein
MSAYTEIARLRFPHCEVTGTGSRAVVLLCALRVVLVRTMPQAEDMAAQSCGPHCQLAIHPTRHFHRIQDLNRPRPSTLARMPGEWED